MLSVPLGLQPARLWKVTASATVAAVLASAGPPLRGHTQSKEVQ